MTSPIPYVSCSLFALAAFTFGTAASVVRAETLITGPSPFANCTADNVAGQSGTNYPNAEVEPFVAANSRNPNNLIAVWQQDRWSDGGARGDAGAYSFDMGKTWATVVPPGTSKCTGGPFDRSSDPWITISPNGAAYFMTLSFDNDIICADGTVISNRNAMTVNRSVNGGRTWGPVINLVDDNDGRIFNDKNAMTADPTDSRYVYASWDKLIDFTVPATCEVAEGDAQLQRVAQQSAEATGGRRDGVEMARERMRAKRSALSSRSAVPDIPGATFTGPTYFVRTTDGGRTWEPEKLIFDPGGDAQTIGNLIEVTPNGAVYNFYTHILADGAVRLEYVRSDDKGASFGAPVIVTDMNVTLTGTLTPDDQAPVRDANILFDTAVDPRSGNLYLVWQDGREGDVDRVAFSMSRNGGRNWTDPVIINQTPASDNPLLNQGFLPSVEVDKNGKVIVTYYDFRNDTADGRESTDFWSISCNGRNGLRCGDQRRWGGEKRMTDVPFNMLDAPIARGHFLGDYMGLARAGSKVIAVYGKAVGKDENDMFSQRAD